MRIFRVLEQRSGYDLKLLSALATTFHHPIPMVIAINRFSGLANVDQSPELLPLFQNQIASNRFHVGIIPNHGAFVKCLISLS